MKRLLLFALMALVMGCTSCNNIKRITWEQSEKNFQVYQNDLISVLEHYGLSLEKCETNEYDDYLSLSFLVTVDDEMSIDIRLHTNASHDRTGREEVEILYRNYGEQPFDLQLFTEVVNTVSGREITQEYCEKFLSDPEEDHSPARYGLQKDSIKKVYKYEFLNFGQDWAITYSEYDDETEALAFWGLTKQLEE